jgi:hypothetical protein
VTALSALSLATAVVAVLATGVVYGTDAFCLLVQRPALRHVDDAVLVRWTGQEHRYGDARMPVPGALALAATAATVVLAGLDRDGLRAALAGVALAALLVWLVAYARVSRPINRRLTAAALAGDTPPDARRLQARWDAVLPARVALQTVAVAALVLAAALP